jgi:hypothetical protein
MAPLFDWTVSDRVACPPELASKASLLYMPLTFQANAAALLYAVSIGSRSRSQTRSRSWHFSNNQGVGIVFGQLSKDLCTVNKHLLCGRCSPVKVCLYQGIGSQAQVLDAIDASQCCSQGVQALPRVVSAGTELESVAVGC